MPTIRVDAEVYGALQSQAAPFVDTPNDVIRRLLRLPDAGRRRGASVDQRPQPSAKKSGRKFGEGIPMTEYRPYILKALSDAGGRAPISQVKQYVRRHVGHKFDSHDLEITQSNAVVWENRVEWQRLEMKHDGLLNPHSPRGIWELTQAGWAEAKKLP